MKRGGQPMGRVLQALLVLLLFATLHAGTALLFLTNTGAGTDAAWGGVPLDDTWIHFVYARNLAEHGGLQFNPGEPEAGFTSPLWILLLGLAYRILLPFGVGLVAVGKVLSILLAVLVSMAAYLLVRHVTGSAWAGILAGVIPALDPTFSFAQVSAMEISLFAAAILLTILYLLRGQWLRGGVALGLTALSRPEGLLLVAAVALFAVIRLVTRMIRGQESQLGAVVRILLPVVILVFPFAWYYHSVNGTPFPNTYLVKRAFHGGGGPEFLPAVWRGYLRHLSYFGGRAWAAAGPLMILGSVVALRRKGLAALPLVLLPWAMWISLGLMLSLSGLAWDFGTRRYLDASIPLIGVLIALGVWQLQAWLLARTSDRSTAQTLALFVTLLCLLLPGRQALGLWRTLPTEYSWNCQNIDEVDVRMARWVRDNLPPDALLAVGDAGAIRFFAPNPVLDLVGLNTHEAIGVDNFTFMAQRKADYAIVFPGLTFDGWPYGRRIHEIRTNYNTILGGDGLVVYQINWHPDFADKSRCYDVDTGGWTELGGLDVGVAASEASYEYQVTQSRGVFDRIFHINAQAILHDEGQVHTGSESMLAPSVPGKDLMVVKRYDVAVRGTVVVEAGGGEAGKWTVAPREFQFGEDAFIIPGNLIREEKTRLTFTFVPGSAPDINSFYYWFYTR